MTFSKPFIFILFINLTFSVFSQNENNTLNYKQLDSIYKYNLQIFNELNINDVNSLIINDCRLSELEFEINRIAVNRLESYFNFKNQEQISIYQNLTNFQLQLNQSRIIINQYLSNIDFWYYKTALEFLSKKDTLNAINYLDKSLLLNELYLPSLQKKTSILNNQNKTLEAASLFTKISPYIYPNNINYQLYKTTASQISGRLEQKALSFYKDGYYSESLEIYQIADSFCNNLKITDCEGIKEGIKNSKIGVYHSYLRIAKQAFSTQNFNISESFTHKALEYAKLNRESISEDSETKNMFRNIFSKYLSISNKYKENGNYIAADNYTDKAKKICEFLNTEDCNALLKNNTTYAITDDFEEVKYITEVNTVEIQNQKTEIVSPNVKKAIKEIKPKTNKIPEKRITIRQIKTDNTSFALYKNMIEIADDYLLREKYEQAYSKYLQAKTMENKAIAKNNPVLDSLLLKTARIIIKNTIQPVDFLIWSNKLYEADTTYLYLINLQKKYQLENDNYTNKLISSLKSRITIKNCNNIQDQINTFANKTLALLNLNEYSKAQYTLNEASNVIEKNNLCNLNLTEITKIENILNPISKYFSLKEKAKELYNKNDFFNCFKYFYLSDSIYYVSKLDSFKIPNSNLIAFLNFHNKENENLLALSYFTENKNYDYALNVLNLLKENNYQSKKLKKEQIQIAQLIAKEHINFNILKTKYPFLKSEKWFKYLLKEYRNLIR